jgi:hypothetical protein
MRSIAAALIGSSEMPPDRSVGAGKTESPARFARVRAIPVMRAPFAANFFQQLACAVEVAPRDRSRRSERTSNTGENGSRCAPIHARSPRVMRTSSNMRAIHREIVAHAPSRAIDERSTRDDRLTTRRLSLSGAARFAFFSLCCSNQRAARSIRDRVASPVSSWLGGQNGEEVQIED